MTNTDNETGGGRLIGIPWPFGAAVLMVVYSAVMTAVLVVILKLPTLSWGAFLMVVGTIAIVAVIILAKLYSGDRGGG